jgi:hypothetical protein
MQIHPAPWWSRPQAKFQRCFPSRSLTWFFATLTCANMSGIKKKIRPGAILVCDNEQALVIEYEQEEYELLEDGSVGASLGKTKGSKKVKVKSLSSTVDLDTCANELMDKCKLIKPSALPAVRAALAQLRNRKDDAEQPALEGKLSAMSDDVASETLGVGLEARRGNGEGSSRRQSKEANQVTKNAGEKNRKEMKKSRREKISSESKAAKHAALESEQKLRQQQQQRFQQQIFEAQARKYAAADMVCLDEYMEQLYDEDTAAKVQGLGMIAQLFRNASNFEVLLAKNGLLQLLARTLREEGKKSMDLSINIVSVFFSVSNFSQFHGLIMDNHVGAMTMDLIGLEVQRTAVRTREHNISPAEIAQKVCWSCVITLARLVACKPWLDSASLQVA